MWFSRYGQNADKMHIENCNLSILIVSQMRYKSKSFMRYVKKFFIDFF